MKKSALSTLWLAPIVVFVASSPTGSEDGSASQDLDGGAFEYGSSVALPVQEETSIESANPTNSISFDESESTLLGQRRDSLLVDNTSPVDGCVSEDSTSDNDIFSRKRAISLNSRDTGACVSGYNKVPHSVKESPNSPLPQAGIHRAQPVRQGSDTDDENPCLRNPQALQYPSQTVHVSCGSHPVGDDPVYPSFVLNCVAGKPPLRGSVIFAPCF